MDHAEHDCVLHVRHIGQDYGTEDELDAVFRLWGHVAMVTVRTRYDEEGEFGPVGYNTSYALVKMGNAKEADAVMEAYAGGHMNKYKSNDQGMHLKVTRFDREVAVNSTGAMAGALTNEHTTIAAMWKSQEEATSRGLSESFILKPKCWDELTKCQTPEAYWW